MSTEKGERREEKGGEKGEGRRGRDTLAKHEAKHEHKILSAIF